MQGSFQFFLRILPRSLHRPVASTDGSLRKNLNKTRVRLWTDRRRRTARLKTVGLRESCDEERTGLGQCFDLSATCERSPKLVDHHQVAADIVNCRVEHRLLVGRQRCAHRQVYQW